MRLILFIFAIYFSVTTAPTQAEERIKIGYVGGFTGSDPNTANELWRGLNIGLDTNPTLRARIDLIKYDNHGDPAATAKIVTQALQNGVKILVGFPTSDEALAAAKVISGQDAMMLAPFATNPAVSQQGDNILQICFSDDFQGLALARFTAKELKPKKVLILTNVESVYSSDLSAAYRKTLSRLYSKAKIIDLIYSKQDLKLDELTKTLQRERPDVVFVPDHIIRASVLIKKAHEIDSRIRFVGGDGLGGKAVFLNVFSGVPNIELYYTGHWHEKIQLAENQAFIERYKKAFPESQPTSGAALTWDAAKIILKAIESSKNTHDVKALLSYIRGGTFDTTTGLLTLKKSRQVPIRPAVLIGLKKESYGYLRQIE